MEPDPQSSAPRRVEAYLDQVLAPLASRLSLSQLGELKRELREHLWARIEAYREFNPGEDAVAEALRQFGGAEDFLRQWQQEWIKMTPSATFREIWSATCCALLPSLSALLITCIGSPIWHRTISVDWAPTWMHTYGFVWVTSGWASFGLDFVVLPLAIGAAVGRLKPRCAGIGMLFALAILLVPAKWVYFNHSGIYLAGSTRQFSWLVLTCCICWLPTTCMAAIFSGWWTLRQRKVLA